MRSGRVRMGMVGGSMEGFIGSVHRIAAALDGKIELVSGVFSSNSEKSKATGRSLNLPDNRIYSSFQEMFETECTLPVNERMEFVSIVTPNHLHFLPAKLALQNGFHVICEKPLAFSLNEAIELEKLVTRQNLLFGITHNYTGYPMIKEAREIVKTGRLGKIRKIIAEYPQGWLSYSIEKSGQRQALWRTDPTKAGISCCVGDIGTHAENLIEYITDLKIVEVAADISTYAEDRLLEDDANILVRLDEGVKGVIMASQIASGEENELKIRIYGEHGGIEWLQSNPNTLIHKSNTDPVKVLKAGAGKAYLSEITQKHCRLPGGHPEGYIESMANIYRNFAMAVERFSEGKSPDSTYDFPDIQAGVRGMRFIEAVIESGKNNSKWVTL